jgi:hypothetical protein
MELAQDEDRTAAAAVSLNNVTLDNDGQAEAATSKSHLVSTTNKKRRHNLGPSSSSFSSSSSSSSEEEGPTVTSKAIPSYTHPSLHETKHTHYNGQSCKDLRYSRIKPSLTFNTLPSVDLFSKIMIYSPGYIMDAKKWLETARKIAIEQGRVFDDVDDWLGLVSSCLFFPLTAHIMSSVQSNLLFSIIHIVLLE